MTFSNLTLSNQTNLLSTRTMLVLTLLIANAARANEHGDEICTDENDTCSDAAADLSAFGLLGLIFAIGGGAAIANTTSSNSAPATVANQAPQAIDDLLIVSINDDLDQVSVPGAGFTRNDTDLDGDLLTITGLVDNVTGATISVDNGDIIITPDMAATELVGTFTYTVTDGQDTSTGTVNVSGDIEADGSGPLDGMGVFDNVLYFENLSDSFVEIQGTDLNDSIFIQNSMTDTLFVNGDMIDSTNPGGDDRILLYDLTTTGDTVVWGDSSTLTNMCGNDEITVNMLDGGNLVVIGDADITGNLNGTDTIEMSNISSFSSIRAHGDSDMSADTGANDVIIVDTIFAEGFIIFSGDSETVTDTGGNDTITINNASANDTAFIHGDASMLGNLGGNDILNLSNFNFMVDVWISGDIINNTNNATGGNDILNLSGELTAAGSGFFVAGDALIGGLDNGGNDTINLTDFTTNGNQINIFGDQESEMITAGNDTFFVANNIDDRTVIIWGDSPTSNVTKGMDTYIFGSGFGTDVLIFDYDVNETIDFTAFNLANGLADLTITESLGEIQIEVIPTGDILTVIGISDDMDANILV